MALARALAVEPEVLLLDEPFGALDAKVRKELRQWLRRLHDEVEVTTIFVTHDQEEAMDVAEQIVVMNEGGVEQAGSPETSTSIPRTEFVMGFVGPVNRRGSLLIRPHDLEILVAPALEAEEAMIERIVHLGFEARVELQLADGEQIWAQMTLRGGGADGADSMARSSTCVRGGRSCSSRTPSQAPRSWRLPEPRRGAEWRAGQPSGSLASLRDRLGQLARHEVGDRHRVEDLMHVGAQRDPYFP